jgi:hypothetical protein
MIAELLSAARDQARARYAGLVPVWIKLSFLLGSVKPASLLSVNIQKDGEVDLILRCLEDDAAALVRQKGQDGLNELDLDFYYVLVRYWIGSMYEAFRILKNANPGAAAIKEIHDELALIRMPLEKHEIASDHKLPGPLKLTRVPTRGDASDEVVYDKNSKTKSHIMPAGMCTFCGSAHWVAIDGKSARQSDLMRRTISDKILWLAKPHAPAAPAAA